MARSFVDAPAVYHQKFAGNCFENRREELCFADGIGPAFDCSGLVIASICKALGRPVDAWTGPRHVRDFWCAARQDDQRMSFDAPAVGSLLVAPRIYTVAGELRVVPGHIGIITRANENEPIRWIHANPRDGKVEESTVVSSGVPLGAVSLAGFFAADFTPERAPSPAGVVQDDF